MVKLKSMEITDVTDVPEKKAPISDEERLALAAKLDDDLDEFINSLEKKKYTEGWNEETWKEVRNPHDSPKNISLIFSTI